MCKLYIAHCCKEQLGDSSSEIIGIFPTVEAANAAAIAFYTDEEEDLQFDDSNAYHDEDGCLHTGKMSIGHEWAIEVDVELYDLPASDAIVPSKRSLDSVEMNFNETRSQPRKVPKSKGEPAHPLPDGALPAGLESTSRNAYITVYYATLSITVGEEPEKVTGQERWCFREKENANVFVEEYFEKRGWEADVVETVTDAGYVVKKMELIPNCLLEDSDDESGPPVVEIKTSIFLRMAAEKVERRLLSEWDYESYKAGKLGIVRVTCLDSNDEQTWEDLVIED